ncbi:MAG: hypothetical protein OXC63_08145 [Aestuariivita sp.]|nr:hypothetical protein [Aestuariivita sp.]MCY4345361.1 hypothetical protein [Aestuariivita sp.]
MGYRYRPNASDKRLYAQSMEKINTQYPSRGTHAAIRTGCKLTCVRPDGAGDIEVIKGEVVNHSYGASTGQHTFTIQTPQGKRRMKGRNLYPAIIRHDPGEESRLQ